MSHRSYPDLQTYCSQTGITQERLAKRLGISQSYMSKIINRIQQPPLDLALKIEGLCRVPLESLLADELRSA